MYIFVGLGNPGKRYDGTRHNIGFAILAQLEQKMEKSTGWQAGKGDFYYAKGIIAGEDIILLMPTTFMNLSGKAVREALAFFKVPISHLIVICDDIALPLGGRRLRLAGSSGGHNGLASIIYELKTDEFARFRIGIGSDFFQGHQAKFVLSKFRTSEMDEVERTTESAVAGCNEIIQNGLKQAMNMINIRVNQPAPLPKPMPTLAHRIKRKFQKSRF
jgi:PTH1 family peptidyl-tRNA hydrolase